MKVLIFIVLGPLFLSGCQGIPLKMPEKSSSIYKLHDAIDVSRLSDLKIAVRRKQEKSILSGMELDYMAEGVIVADDSGPSLPPGIAQALYRSLGESGIMPVGAISDKLERVSCIQANDSLIYKSKCPHLFRYVLRIVPERAEIMQAGQNWTVYVSKDDFDFDNAINKDWEKIRYTFNVSIHEPLSQGGNMISNTLRTYQFTMSKNSRDRSISVYLAGFGLNYDDQSSVANQSLQATLYKISKAYVHDIVFKNVYRGLSINDQVITIQTWLGVETDAIWGKRTNKKWEKFAQRCEERSQNGFKLVRIGDYKDSTLSGSEFMESLYDGFESCYLLGEVRIDS